MTFKESIRRNLGKEYFFAMRDRASRSEYWWFMLFILLANLASSQLLSIFPEKLAMSAILVISLLLFPPNLGVTVRRLHDRNLKGWWILLPITPLVFWFLSGGPQSNQGTLFNLLALLLSLSYLAILCMPGTPGVNRFGPPPEIKY